LILVSVRGAAGLNLMVHSAEFNPADPAQNAFVQSCRNVDLSIERAVMPRRGFLRATSWAGLLYDEATGDLFSGISSLTGPITVLFPDPSAWAAKPGVDT
jgi:hypothetical protein